MGKAKPKKTVDMPILLPKMGESVSEATIIEWYKKPGESIAVDELFVLIGTDKVESELPSMYAGTLKQILIKEKEEVAVGEPICILEVDAKQVESLNKTKQVQKSTKKANVDNTLKPNKYQDSKNFLSPVVRKIATENGLELSDLEKIKGTGQNGRVRKADIMAYLNKQQTKHQRGAGMHNQKLDLPLDVGDKVNALSRMQQLLANHLQQSFMEIPHVTTFAELDVTDIFLHREEIIKEFILEQGTKITYTHYIQFAAILSLKEFPMLNAWMNVDEVVIKSNIHMGFATALENGDLIVPNVKNAQQMDFVTWIKAVNNKAKDAKNHQLNNDDVQGTTFTISNTGMFGSLAGTPIVSRPQVAVLALGQIGSAPGVVLVNGKEIVAVRKKMMLSISYDHRVINGAYASQFLMKIKENLKGFKDWFKT